MIENTQQSEFKISEITLNRWQTIVDIMAELINIPAALIMRLVEADIEVFISSKSEGNPYTPGDKEHCFGSGLYCETVISTQNKLLIPNALNDEKWKNNPDIKFGLISYIGFPIRQPNGQPFGTICVLDNKENAYSKTYESLISNFRDIIEGQLELIYMNHELGGENKKLSDYISEIKTLRGFIPICGFCKKVRDDEGFYKEVEVYVSEHTEAEFSHGVCPGCKKIHYPELKNR
jgi:GAF domain